MSFCRHHLLPALSSRYCVTIVEAGKLRLPGVHSSLKERAGVKRVSACGFAGAEVFAGRAELAPWLPLSPRRCRVRASGRAGSRTGRSPAADGGAGGVLDAGAREPMIKGLRGRVPAVQG